MATIPVKVQNRFQEGLKRYKRILTKAQSQDINESDTVTIITDVLQDIFGYDKYSEITSEFAIKKTFCDLAIKIDDDVKMLIEVKSAGLNLKDTHLKQAVDYGANSGIDWVILTNGVIWKVYKIIFSKPIDHELVYEFDITQLNTRKQEDMDYLYLLSKESISKSSKASLQDFHAQKQLVNKYIISQILLSEDAAAFVRRSIKKVSSEAKPTIEEILSIIGDEIIKREVLEDDRTAEAKKKVHKALKK